MPSTFMTSEANQSVVIIGGGVIGLSTAYYLATSAQPRPSSIIVLDSSPELFQCASGRAAGFLAKDWFHSSTQELGELSFRLHKELAEAFDGGRRWGYAGSTSLSVSQTEGHSSEHEKGNYWEDWLFGGRSRGLMANDSSTSKSKPSWPEWLSRSSANGSVLSGPESTAQLDPRRFCEFLLQKCQEHDVQIVYPATATSLTVNSETGLPKSLSYTTKESSENLIPCSSVLLAAGPWTARVYKTLFPQSKLVLPISNLAGWSVVFRSPTAPRPSKFTVPCHAVFTTSNEEGFAPEFFSRTLPADDSDGYDIYLAGLNSAELPLPEFATGVESSPDLHDPQITTLIRFAERLLVDDSAHNSATDLSLRVLRTGLCHRPVTTKMRPIVTRIEPHHYSGVDQIVSDKAQGGIFVAAGHGPWGITMSLGTGKVCADMMVGSPAPDFLNKLALY